MHTDAAEQPPSTALRDGRLPPAFFARDARVLARALVGCRLVFAPHDAKAPRVTRIVETEAYCGPRDAASHARAGLTNRTRALFGPPGHAYVFFVYGMHDCFNVTCLAEGSGHAVLIRAGEPSSGFAPGTRLDGPGRFARAMGLTRIHSGQDLSFGPLYLCGREGTPRVATSARVGVAYAGVWADKPWRFFDPRSVCVSRPPKKSIGRG